MEGQERNTAQLVRIGAVVDQRWNLKEDLQDSDEKIKEENRNNEEGSEDVFEESQEVIEERILLSISY